VTGHLQEEAVTRVTQEHVDARREAILEAATRLFARQGISGTTMADIAHDADLSAGAIYRYYASKEELVHAVFDDAIAQNQKIFDGAAGSAGSPFEAMLAVGRKAWIDHDDRDALVCDIQMTLAAAYDPEDFGLELSRTWGAVRGMLKEMVCRAQASGELDPNVDPETLALILQATTAGMQMLKLDKHNDIDVEAAFELMVKMVLGLRDHTTHDDEREA
jgi:TetR/AcrR family transcriptional regulator, transcriptional repressor of aconitase